MEKEFIPYKQALALKELRFDEECFSRYCIITRWESATGKIVLQNVDCVLSDKNLIKAPLYQQAFRWFREIHNLHGFIENSCIMNDNNYNCFINATDQSVVGLKSKRLFNMYNFKTHEEAELECFKKLIEIIKKK